jgi:hypothetical protein
MRAVVGIGATSTHRLEARRPSASPALFYRVSVHSIGVFAACWGKTDRLANSQRQNGKTDLRLRPPLAGLQLIRGGLRELEVTEEVLPDDVASFRNKTKQKIILLFVYPDPRA